MFSVHLLEVAMEAGILYWYEAGVGRNVTGDVVSISPTAGVLIGNTSQTLTYGLKTLGTLTDGILLGGTLTDGIEIGTATTGINISGATTTGLLVAGTATDGISVTGVCADAIHISGANTATGLHISGNQVDCILIDVDVAADNGVKIAVDDGITLGAGLSFTRTGTTGVVTTAISIDTDGTTGISIGTGFTGVTGLTVAGTASGDGILISGACADGIHISGTNTVTGLHISGDQVDAILIDIDSAADNGLKIAIDDGLTLGTGINIVRTGTTGVATTAINIDTDGTTGIAITTGFTGVTGISIAGTASGDGILVSGACLDGIHISGTNTGTGLHISGDQVDAILIDVDSAADNGLKIAVDDGITLGAGISLTRTGTTGVATTGISIDTDGTTALSIGTGFTGTTGVLIAGTATNGISITGATGTGVSISGSATTAISVLTGAFGTGLSLAGTLTTGINIAACVTGLSITGICTNAIAIDGANTGTDGWALRAGTTGAPIAVTAAGSALAIYETTSATTGSQRTLVVDTKCTGTTTTTFSPYSIRGHVQLSANTIGGAGSFTGVQGKFTLGGGTINHADSRVCALLAQLDISSGTYTTGQLSVLWVDAGASGNPGAGDGQGNLVRISNTTSWTPNAVIYGYAKASFLLDLSGPGGNTDFIVASGGTYSTADGYLRVKIHGATMRIPYFAAVDS